MLARAIVILINLGLLGLMGWGTFSRSRHNRKPIG